MRPLADWPLESRRRVRIVLTDLDDTLTRDGRLPAAAYAALERLGATGLSVLVCTGRSAGWGHLIATLWPVRACVAENGAVAFWRDGRGLRRRHWLDDAARDDAAQRRGTLAATILAHVPGARRAGDQDFRTDDLAIDHAEAVEPLPAAAVQRILDLARAAGATASASSIHVNAGFGPWDKFAMAQRLFGAWGEPFDGVAAIGDGPNDQALFAGAEVAVGVASVRRHTLAAAPHWVTSASGAEGFLEFADALLAAHGDAAS